MNNEVNKISFISLKKNSLPQFNSIIVGRVIDIILDDSHPEFNKLGQWDSLGTVFFSEVNKVISNDINLDDYSHAKPLFPNQKYFPLKNEIIYIISFPVPDSQNIFSLTGYYYLNVINIWNHPHHNALPRLNNIDEQINNNFNSKAIGNTTLQKNTSTNLDLGNTFKEKDKVNTLLPYEGDYIIEGRWGNSIRFGSTVKNVKISNQWSENSNEGDPITIIRNGQVIKNDKGWVPQLEDINGDDSSIYMTSNHQIPLEVSSKNLKTFNITITNESNYKTTNITGSNPNLNSSTSQDNFTIDQSFLNQDSETIDTIEVSDEYNNETSPSSSDKNNYLGNTSIYYNVGYQSQNDSNDPNIRKYGCAATACAMLISYVTKDNYSKEKIIELNGGVLINFENLAQKLNLNYKELNNYNELNEVLQTQPAIVLIKSLSAPSNPLKQHFVVAIGINDNGDIIIHDPVRKFGPNIILSKSRYNLLSPRNKIRIFY